MKNKWNFLLSLFFIVFTACSDSDSEPGEPGEGGNGNSNNVLAFPHADGAGAYTTGGRGGYVYYVTTLEDRASQVGSLRYGLMTLSGKRTILFKVAGTIELNSELRINNGDVTIAGQSAPGDGICIKNYPLVINANNVIIRFLRFRMGDEKSYQGDAVTCTDRTNVIIDHCSMSWSTDECVSCYDNTNFTLQWCIISESLKNSVHGKGSHGYGGIWGGKKASFHHNLLAHHDSRNPRFNGSRYSNDSAGEEVDFRNNVIYNWGSNSGYAGEGGSYNMVNNYYKPGPATRARGGAVAYRIFQPNSDDGSNNQTQGIWGTFYVNGNIMDGNAQVTSDNWNGGIQPNIKDYDGNFSIDNIKSVTPFPITTYAVSNSATEAYAIVLEKAGASLKRDKVDTRIISEVRENTYTYNGSNGSSNGIIDTQSDVGGWSAYSYITDDVLMDSDGDGIPDVWEDANGLDKNNEVDGRLKTLHPDYTNLEVYLNSLVENLY
ncbi:MAG: pectate lyase [Candidatus Azobacteroides sp.]|nr:pectate lyase [Candidatus Azobacteroides sp.]